ncbi:MAG: acetyl-CoA carboxyl transferase [Polaromonas sp. 28-63-22]|nr:MAG: acetyl-CoA carboxyl transferase [Polaromonas sp. 28-63-22]
MSFFRRPDYTSEATQFIEQLKADKPTLEAEQRAGRALLWDKNLNRADQADYLDGKVPQQGYVYGTAAHPNSQ